MDKLVMQGVPMTEDGPRDMRVGEMGELLDMLASYNNVSNAWATLLPYQKHVRDAGAKFMVARIYVLPTAAHPGDAVTRQRALRGHLKDDRRIQRPACCLTGRRRTTAAADRKSGLAELRGTDEGEPDDDQEPRHRAERKPGRGQKRKRAETGNRQETEPPEKPERELERKSEDYCKEGVFPFLVRPGRGDE